MQLLSFQSIQHQQSRERGRLRSLRNHVNSLTAHDYLLAATVVMMDLYHHKERLDPDVSTPSTSVSGGSISQGSNVSEGVYAPGLSYCREDLIKALEDSREIWMINRDFSIEAYKASELLNVLLHHVRLPSSPSNPPHTQLSAPGRQAQGSSNDEQTAAMTLEMLQAGRLSSGAPISNASQPASPGPQWDRTGTNATPGVTGDYNSGLFPTGLANAPSPFPNGFFNNAMSDIGPGMNLDWVS